MYFKQQKNAHNVVQTFANTNVVILLNVETIKVFPKNRTLVIVKRVGSTVAVRHVKKGCYFV